MEIIQAKKEHIVAICRITADAKAQLKRMGVDQWQRGYPNRSVWLEDIEKGEAWVAVEEDKVIGAFTFKTEPEEAYIDIDGRWLSDRPYAVLHRVCVAAECKGKGIAGKLFEKGCELTRSRGLSSLRIDTHRDNRSMQRAVAKAGFGYCGVIHLVGGAEDGRERIGFELLL